MGGGAWPPPPPPDPPIPQDSLLAAPIMLDLALLTELCQRVSFCTDADPEPQTFHPVLSLLSFLFKAPLVPPGSPVVNALFRQRSCIENILRCAPASRFPIQGPDTPWLSYAQGLGGYRRCLALLSCTASPGPAWGSRHRTTCYWSIRWSAQGPSSSESDPWLLPALC